MKPTRQIILNAATTITLGDREAAYGPPWRNLTDCAQLFEAYLHGKFDCDIKLTAEDVAHFNTLQKIVRTFRSEYREDNYVDAAAYQAIAGECRLVEEEK
jgi:hypothetical protein